MRGDHDHLPVLAALSARPGGNRVWPRCDSCKEKGLAFGTLKRLTMGRQHREKGLVDKRSTATTAPCQARGEGARAEGQRAGETAHLSDDSSSSDEEEEVMRTTMGRGSAAAVDDKLEEEDEEEDCMTVISMGSEGSGVRRKSSGSGGEDEDEEVARAGECVATLARACRLGTASAARRRSGNGWGC